MKMRLKIILVCIGVATLIKTQAQAELDYNESSSMLTFEQALAKTLENNYDIKVAKINTNIGLVTIIIEALIVEV